MTTDLPAADLPAALRAHARGLLACEAAVELLLAHRCWPCRSDFAAGFVHRCPGSHGAGLALVDWAAAAGAVTDGRLPCSGGERRILQVAASLAEGVPVDLREALTGLDEGNLDLVAAAVRHAGGHLPKLEGLEGEGGGGRP